MLLRHQEQLSKFCNREGTPLAPPIQILSQLRHHGHGRCHQPAGLDAPVQEGIQDFAQVIHRACRFSSSSECRRSHSAGWPLSRYVGP
jgi:hypothetical protein